MSRRDKRGRELSAEQTGDFPSLIDIGAFCIFRDTAVGAVAERRPVWPRSFHARQDDRGVRHEWDTSALW